MGEPIQERVDLACGCWGLRMPGCWTRRMKGCDRHIDQQRYWSAKREREKAAADRRRRERVRLLEWLRIAAFARRLPVTLRVAGMFARVLDWHREHQRERRVAAMELAYRAGHVLLPVEDGAPTIAELDIY